MKQLLQNNARVSRIIFPKPKNRHGGSLRCLTCIVMLTISFSARAQWTLIDTITGANFMVGHFFSADSGIIGGEITGKFIRTANGGASWDTVMAPVPSPLFDMKFVNSTVGYACGGSGFSSIHNVLMRTNNRGSSWDTVLVNYFPMDYSEYMELSFNSVDTGVILTTGAAYKTVNGGTSISIIPSPSTGFIFQHCVLLANHTLIVAGMIDSSGTFVNKLCRSTDWGAHWSMLFSDNMRSIGRIALSGSSGIAVCDKGWILRSSDGGISWAPDHIATDSFDFFRVSYGASGHVYLSAIKNYAGYLFTSGTGGASFAAPALINSAYAIWQICMPTAATGYLITNRHIYKTTTGGGLLDIANTYRSDDIRIYPNPASAIAHIDADPQNIRSVTVFDMAGKTVAEFGQGTISISTRGLSPGVYLIHIETTNSSVVKKLQVD